MNIIVDTGPIVALLDENDSYHPFIDKKMRELPPPFYTCEAVLPESMFLVQQAPNGMEKLIELLDSGRIIINFSYKRSANKIHRLIESYMDLPMSFADACLVCMYDDIRGSQVFTVDSDFNIYRDHQGEPLSLIFPQTV